MSLLRPECGTSTKAAISDDTALFLIRNSVLRRRELIFGRLHDGRGNHCAIGAFWEDNPKVALNATLIDEVAAVNDSVPETCTPKERWKKVNSWLRFKISVLTNRKGRNGRP